MVYQSIKSPELIDILPSGKTKVLTARVAYLIHHFGLQPEEIVAVSLSSLPAIELPLIWPLFNR